MQKCVNELVRHLKPTTSEEEIYCRYHSKWISCSSNECCEKCEQYYKAEDIEYIYRVEIDFYEVNGKYHYELLCRDKSDTADLWKVCVVGDCDTVQGCFDLANYWCERLKKK